MLKSNACFYVLYLISLTKKIPSGRTYDRFSSIVFATYIISFFFHPLTRFLFWIYCYILYYIILFLLLLIMCVPMGGWSNRFMKILCDFFSIPFFCFFKYTSHPVSQPSSHSTYGSPFEKNKFLISNIFIFSIKLLTEMK